MYISSDFHLKNSKSQKTQFVKINRKRKGSIWNGLGHSQITTNNFSRRNSVNTTVSSVTSIDPTKSLPETITLKTPNCLSTCRESRRLHSQQSWLMPQHLKNIKNAVDNYDDFKEKRNKYKFTEQRCNYERIVEQLRQELQRSWPPEQVINSHSRILTFTADQNQCQYNVKASDEISKDFLNLSEFRTQNSKDCFYDRQQQETLLEPTDKTNGCELKDCKKISKHLPSLSLSAATSLSPTPYPVLQRMLRNELANDFSPKIISISTVNRSAALSYQEMY